MSEDAVAPKISDVFRQMADEIDKNAPDRFGGAFVIVTPDGEVKDMLLLNRQQDLAMFWSSLKTTCEIAIAQIVEAERTGSAFGMQRR